VCECDAISGGLTVSAGSVGSRTLTFLPPASGEAWISAVEYEDSSRSAGGVLVRRLRAWGQEDFCDCRRHTGRQEHEARV
jgi:hypothetical protein